MDKITLKMWSVQTTGGQIITDQEPQEVTVTFASADSAVRARQRGFTWDSTANYYLTKEKARHAINWALSN
nr:MAG TPA: hypothetical protein [Bacteriophage sp.]